MTSTRLAELLDFERTRRLERLIEATGPICDELEYANEAISGIRLNLQQAADFLDCGRHNHARAVIAALIAEIDGELRKAS